AVELFRTSDALSTEKWHQQVQSRVTKENELVLDPLFFYALQRKLPQITRVDVQLKRGRGRNELTQFRYDVILHIGTGQHATVEAPPHETFDWQQEGLTVDSLRHLLTTQNPQLLVVQNVPDARIFEASQALQLIESTDAPETVGELRTTLAMQAENAVEPDDLFALENELPYRVEIRPTNNKGRFEVIIRHNELPAETTVEPSVREWKPLSHYATNPMRAKLANTLVPQYRSFLAAQLPDFMVPSAFVILDEFPLTPNGKVDRKALPSPDKDRTASQAEFVAPRNDIEELVADVWKQVLGMEQVGIHDNFFELGGHSLLATQVASRLRDALEIELSLQRLFEASTIAQIAELIEEILMAEFDALSEEEMAQLMEEEQ
ncbi:MAG: phosphopantetheine-binding protein, partial [Tumebacillaceae bacterium]